MSRKYRKIANWLKDVERALTHPAQNMDESALPELGWSFGLVREQLVNEPELTRELFRLLNVVRNASGAGRTVFERRVLVGLALLASDVSSMTYEETLFPQPLAANPEIIPSDQRATFVVLQELCLFAMDCFRFSRPRDSFSGERRRQAFELMANASAVIEPPNEFFTYLKKALKKARNQEVIGAILFCEEYYARVGGVPEDVMQLLFGLVEKTKSRGIASGALNVLVESGDINEFEALDRIDDWKDRHRASGAV